MGMVGGGDAARIGFLSAALGAARSSRTCAFGETGANRPLRPTRRLCAASPKTSTAIFYPRTMTWPIPSTPWAPIFSRVLRDHVGICPKNRPHNQVGNIGLTPASAGRYDSIFFWPIPTGGHHILGLHSGGMQFGLWRCDWLRKASLATSPITRTVGYPPLLNIVALYSAFSCGIPVGRGENHNRDR
jgi:hypothetical protein